MSSTSNKCYEIQFGYIEPSPENTAMALFHRQEIKAGRMVELSKVYKKLKHEMETSDYLMTECIKLAVKMGHKVY